MPSNNETLSEVFKVGEVMLRKIVIGLVAGTGGLLLSGVVAADDAPLEDLRAWGISGNCIESHRMRNVRFRDDRTAIIRMAGGKQVLMTLERRCPGIRSRGFLHATSINKLCTSDPLRVIDTGSVCMIRSFTPYLGEEDEAEEKDPAATRSEQ